MAHPLMDPHYFEHDDDLKTLLKGVELTRAFAKTAPLNQYLKSEAVPGEHVTSEVLSLTAVRNSSATHSTSTAKQPASSRRRIVFQISIASSAVRP